ncbi:MAG: hypothetical protein WCQ50_10255 [Spirochaetota bacterium]
MKGCTLKVREDATEKHFEVRVDETGEPTQIYASNNKESLYFPITPKEKELFQSWRKLDPCPFLAGKDMPEGYTFVSRV